jgi:hypothetical protein
MAKQIGAVIVFKECVTRACAEAWIDQMQTALDHKYGTQVGEFDPKYGGPVWYVP